MTGVFVLLKPKITVKRTNSWDLCSFDFKTIPLVLY